MESSKHTQSDKKINISGQLSSKLTFAPLKILSIVTGVALLIGLFKLAARYLLLVRKKATASFTDDALTIETQYSLLGKPIKQSKLVFPIQHIRSISLENQRRYVHQIVGFGCLVVGLFSGVHWILDGLGAGYPYLALLGAAAILTGMAIDLILYFFIPESSGTKSVSFVLPKKQFRLVGVDSTNAHHILSQYTELSSKASSSGGE